MNKFYLLENHPQDSRVKITENDICQTLDARMGMGGGNVPMILEVYGENDEQDNPCRDRSTDTQVRSR